MTEWIDSWGACPVCKERTFLQNHQCKPAWYVWQDEYEGTPEDARKVFAARPDQAAEEYAAWYDMEGYSCYGKLSQERRVNVIEGKYYEFDDDGITLLNPEKVRIYSVTGELVPSYYSEEAKKETKDGAI